MKAQLFDIGTLVKVLVGIFFITIFVGILLSLTGLSFGDLLEYSFNMIGEIISGLWASIFGGVT